MIRERSHFSKEPERLTSTVIEVGSQHSGQAALEDIIYLPNPVGRHGFSLFPEIPQPHERPVNDAIPNVPTDEAMLFREIRELAQIFGSYAAQSEVSEEL